MKTLSQHDFEQMWQANGYTMLSMDLGVTFPFSTTKHWLCSFNDKNWFFTFENNVGSMYYSKQEMELAEYWGRRDFLNEDWFTNYISRSKELYGSAYKFYHDNPIGVLQSLSDDELYLIARKAGLLLSDVYAYFNTVQPQCVAGLEKDLTAELEKKVESGSVRDVLLDLTRSDKRTMLEEESVAWLKLEVDALSGDSLVDALKKHSKEYGILGTADGGDYYAANYYQKLYGKQDAASAEEKLDERISEEKRISEQKAKLAAKYSLSDSVTGLGGIIAEIGHNRFELRLRGWMPLDFWFVDVLLPHLSDKSGIEVRLLRQLTFQELLQYLLTGAVDKDELKRRSEHFVIGMEGGAVFYRSGDESRELAESLVPIIEKDVAELKGQIAQKGVVEGEAYVLHWNAPDVNKEMEEMPGGAILVAGQTRPQLMPAIKKAAAIVTDEGGITSHAAIVSRELGTPCVIGTKTATKVISTGDWIKVDADSGIVHLLK